jgi:hypothetical protein
VADQHSEGADGVNTADRATPWQDRAVCDGMDPDLFESPGRARGWGLDRRAEIKRCRIALAACATCPVRRQCDEDAQRFKPTGVIRAGHVYNDVGRKARLCPVCRRPILSDSRNTRCEDHLKGAGDG